MQNIRSLNLKKGYRFLFKSTYFFDAQYRQTTFSTNMFFILKCFFTLSPRQNYSQRIWLCVFLSLGSSPHHVFFSCENFYKPVIVRMRLFFSVSSLQCSLQLVSGAQTHRVSRGVREVLGAMDKVSLASMRGFVHPVDLLNPAFEPNRPSPRDPQMTVLVFEHCEVELGVGSAWFLIHGIISFLAFSKLISSKTSEMKPHVKCTWIFLQHFFKNFAFDLFVASIIGHSGLFFGIGQSVVFQLLLQGRQRFPSYRALLPEERPGCLRPQTQ